MTWGQAFLFVGYAVVAAGMWSFGDKLIGKSPAGRKAVPLVALLWPVLVVMVVAIGFTALLDAAVDRGLEQVFGPREDRVP